MIYNNNIKLLGGKLYATIFELTILYFKEIWSTKSL